jgi:hypothetical protein
VTPAEIIVTMTGVVVIVAINYWFLRGTNGKG